MLVFYFAFSSGVVINLHYCMDRFDSFSIGASASDVCGKCGMHTTDANGCCRDELKVIKIDDGQLASGIQLKFNTPAVAEQPEFFVTAGSVQDLSIQYSGNHSPPPDKQPVYLRNRVFRI